MDRRQLKEARLKLGLTQTQMAETLNNTPFSTYQKWEDGRTKNVPNWVDMAMGNMHPQPADDVLPIKKLKEKYGKGKKTRQLYNAAIRAECPGGSELLDLIELVSKMRHQRAVSIDEYSKLLIVEDRLQVIRDRMYHDVKDRWGIEDI
ncbi:MAG: helix-turn-helix transcriptional regulator [Desulforhopalus sp.]